MANAAEECCITCNSEKKHEIHFITCNDRSDIGRHHGTAVALQAGYRKS